MTVRQPYKLETVNPPTLFKAIEATADLLEVQNSRMPPAGTLGFRLGLRWRRQTTEYALSACKSAGLSLLPIDLAQQLLQERTERQLAYNRRHRARRVEQAKREVAAS